MFKGRSMKLLKKCIILFKKNKIEGPNIGSFIKKVYSTKMDDMMILIMIPLLLMMLLPWQQNYRLPEREMCPWAISKYFGDLVPNTGA
jgi:hypothetical protein